MADAEEKPLAELLFGSETQVAAEPDTDLALLISAWFRRDRSKVRSTSKEQRSVVQPAMGSEAPPL